MTALDLLLIILGVLAVIPCTVLYFRERGNAYKFLMILSFIAGPIWVLSIVFFRNASTEELVLKYAQVIYINSIFLGLSFFLFEQYFPRKKIHTKLFTSIVITVALFLMYSVISSDWFIEYPILFESNSVKLGWAYIVWMVWMLGIFSLGLINILKDYRNLGKIEKHQLRYFIIGIIIPVIGVVPTNAILPLLGEFSFIWIGPLAMCFMSFIITWGLATKASNNKYQLQVAIIKMFSLLLFISEVSILSVLFTKRYVYFEGIIEKLIWILLFMLFTVGSYYAGKYLVEIIIKELFKEKIPDYTKVRDKYLDVTAEILDNNELVRVTIGEILKYISVTWCGAILVDDENERQILSDKSISVDFRSHKLLMLNISEISKELDGLCNRDVLEFILNNDYDKYPTKLLKKMEFVSNFLCSIGASEIMLISSGYETYGFFLLGYKRGSSASLNQKERELVNAILRNLSLGLSRSNLHKEVKLANKSLQQKVDDQTQELQIKVKQLQEARRKESDMIDIMGHELRTPATVVKLNVALLEKYIKTNPEEFKKYLDRIKQAVETEISLINTLLTSAKLEGNKIEIKKEKVDVREEIEMSIHGHEEELNSETRLVSNIPKNLGYAYADRVRVAEVLNNLIGNAIKFTDNGLIVVSAKSDNKDIHISVKDSGKGIAKNNVSRLGEKFFRVDNYLESDIVRPGGTGLGLYITYRLVRLMGGDIKVESKVGEGSTFTFTLPKYKGQQISASQDSVDRFKRLGLKK